MATKTIKILVHSKLQQPPLFNGHFFRLYLPDTITLAPNTSCKVNLKFQIITPGCISKQVILSTVFREQFIETNTNNINTDLNDQVYLDLTNKSHFFIYKFLKKHKLLDVIYLVNIN